MNKLDNLLTPELQSRYPRSAKYDIQWIYDNRLGSHCLWLMETLCQAMEILPGMRILDLGCGKALSSVFLAREFGVQVWATDLLVSASENLDRIQKAGVADKVFPLQADARALPFAENFFDAVVSINSMQIYGTDDMYLERHLAKLVKPGGQIAAIVPGFRHEISGCVPLAIQPEWGPALYNWHSAAWWQWHWQKTGAVEVELADNLPDGEGFAIFDRWERAIGDSQLCQRDKGEHVTFVRLMARRK